MKDVAQQMTVKEAAEFLGYHPNHVYRLLREGVLDGEKFGHAWMVSKSSARQLKSQQGNDGRLPMTDRQ